MEINGVFDWNGSNRQTGGSKKGVMSAEIEQREIGDSEDKSSLKFAEIGE